MRPSSRGVGLLLLLAAGSLATVAQIGVGQIMRQGDELAAIAGDMAAEEIDLTGSIGAAGGARSLPLTDEERGRIFDHIMQIRGVPEMSVPDGGTAMPEWVALQDMPASVTSDIPMVRGYKFVKLVDRIVLVRPADRSVVAMMPRYKLIVD